VSPASDVPTPDPYETRRRWLGSSLSRRSPRSHRSGTTNWDEVSALCNALLVSKTTLMGYSHAFLVAADEHATTAKEKGLDGEVDGMMCVIALQNAVVGATKVLGKDHAAVKACEDEAKDLKNVRDMLTHFDDYAMGTGNLQKSLDGVDGPFGWMPMWNSPETILILTRRQGEDEATHYEVPIHKALKSVAVLVAAAADSLNMTPSSILEKLTGTE
jgi:hypothetical protein